MNELKALIQHLAASPSHLASLTPEQRNALLAALRSAVVDAADDGVAGSDLLTVAEAAALLKVTPRWLYRHARKMPFTRKLSRKVLRFSRAALDRWVERQRT